jgi:hypothetical protein
MIINIRGTSGSGKSTLVRRVRDLYDSCVRVKEDGRKQPIGYILGRADGGKALALIGHYETDCGGCDTITSMDTIYAKVREAHHHGMDVLYEGLLISADANRAVALHSDGFHPLVIALDTPLDVCLESVNRRRLEAHERRLLAIGAENIERAAAGRKLILVPAFKGEVNPKNTQSKFSGVKSSMKRLEAAGVNTVWLSRDGAFERIKQEFKL